MVHMKRLLTILGALLVLAVMGSLLWSAPKEQSAQDREEQDFDATSTPPALTLATTTVSLPDGTTAEFRLAEPFALSVAAEGLGKARFMAMSPDGRMFVPDLVDYNLSHEGKIFILDDFNEETGEFETTHTYLSGLRGPNSVAFYTDEDGNDWLYVALTAHLLRYPYEAGDTAPSGEPEIIVEFPNTQTPGEESVVWHITRTLLFEDDRLYISIGSGCNSCEQREDALRGMITSMNPDGSDVEVYAEGLRNSVGIEWARGSLYATANGVDHLGTEAPDELMYRIDPNVHYGWPYCYEVDGVLYEDTARQWENPLSCEEVPRSFAAFPPRSAPLGLTYFADAHPVLEDTFLVALHGSFEPELRRGNALVRVSSTGAQDIFMDGFQASDGRRVGRPVDILQHDEDSFFFTDDLAGRVYYVHIKD